MTDDPFIFVIFIACLIVGAILAWGMKSFQAGGDGKKSNKIMQLRILAQFIAVVIIVGFAYFKSTGS